MSGREWSWDSSERHGPSSPSPPPLTQVLSTWSAPPFFSSWKESSYRQAGNGNGNAVTVLVHCDWRSRSEDYVGGPLEQPSEVPSNAVSLLSKPAGPLEWYGKEWQVCPVSGRWFRKQCTLQWTWQVIHLHFRGAFCNCTCSAAHHLCTRGST